MSRRTEQLGTKGAATAAALDAGGAGTAAPQARAEVRACPTRVEDPQPLIQHRVTVPQCQGKQRRQYHKCFTCMHWNERR